MSATRCGMVAIVGRPNVGKSTLLNRILGQKLSITSRKPQTTRYRILGVKTAGGRQSIYIDTPGLQVRPQRALNRSMNREAEQAMHGVDVILFMVEAMKWSEGDELVLERLRGINVPVVLVVNKADQVRHKPELLPFLEEMASRMSFAEIVPASAQTADNLNAVERAVAERLPARAFLFPDDQITDRSVRFLAAEIVREKLVRLLGQELPYATGVVIDRFEERGDIARIAATIWVERPGQKRIVVGKRGAVLKRVGAEARKEIETMLGTKVFLQTWVKVKENWADNADLLMQLGIGNAPPA